MTGDDPSQLVEEHSPMIWMLLPETETKAIVDLPKGVEWKDHAQSVRYVYGSSRLGESLMAGAIVAVSELDVQENIEAELDQMGKCAKIDDKVVAKTLQNINAKLET
eukprot:343704-Amphidinium_carterae.1